MTTTTTTTTVLIETMPAHLRASHRAARNWGVYPHNGAERRRVPLEEAEEICDPEYDHIVDGSLEVTVPADTDADDCLAAAAEAYVLSRPEAEGWDLEPRWEDETRERVVLSVPFRF